MPNPNWDPLGLLDEINLGELVDFVYQAGHEIMNIYHQYQPGCDLQVQIKADDSPLTKADLASHYYLVERLSNLTLSGQVWPVLSEENVQDIQDQDRTNYTYYWLVDPLDGTKEFIKKNGEFTVNVALIYKDRPIAGVVGVPCQHKVYYALKGHGAFRQTFSIGQLDQLPSIQQLQVSKFCLETQPNNQKPLRLVASRSHLNQQTQTCIDQLSRGENQNIQLVQAGSSLKFMLVAEGQADIYPRLAPTMEWDTGASQIIVEEAGGQVVQLPGSLDMDLANPDWLNLLPPVVYSKKDLHNPYFLVLGKAVPV